MNSLCHPLLLCCMMMSPLLGGGLAAAAPPDHQYVLDEHGRHLIPGGFVALEKIPYTADDYRWMVRMGANLLKGNSFFSPSLHRSHRPRVGGGSMRALRRHPHLDAHQDIRLNFITCIVGLGTRQRNLGGNYGLHSKRTRTLPLFSNLL
jgi:hypothetical protein